MVWRTLVLRAKIPSDTLQRGEQARIKVVKPYIKQVYRETAFIDRIRMKVAAGAGGSGYPKINGLGGNGGSVYIEAVEGVTLQKVLRNFPERRVKAGVGENSRPHVLLGDSGRDVTIEVPPGVSVVDSGNRELVDLVNPGQKFLVAQGGVGGCPKNGFLGRKGKEAIIGLYLKLIADIGFVGFPNAGKSTLLRGLSRARPKVAAYPFTTLRPNIGIMEYEDFRQITLADLPGLIEGAHKNAGLGHNFLRHVERTNLLMFVVDIQGFRLNENSEFRTAFETVMSLNKELELYRTDLVHKPALLVLNKIDTSGACEKLEEFDESMASQQAFDSLPDEVRPTSRMDFKDTIHISAKDMKNIETLQEKLRVHLDELYEMNRSMKDVEKPPVELPQLVNQLV